jgi:xylulokinase
MHIVADVLQAPLQGLKGHLGSCIGAAWTAAMGAKLVQDWGGAARFVELDDIIEPDPANAPVYTQGYGAYRDLYHRLASSPVRQ